MKKIFLTLAIVAFTIFSCKNEPEKPKVSYEDSIKTKKNITKEDTTKIEIADLPIQFAGTNVLLFPIGKIKWSRTEKYAFESSGDENENFKISNNNDNEISGFLNNIKFQTIGQDTIKPLSDKKIMIQSVTYLKEFATKTKKQFLVYAMEDADTNKDGTIDANDINTLYLSDINGNRFTKISKDFQELIDWQLLLSTNRLYFRTIEDTNKNGLFDKDDNIKYQYIDLFSADWKVLEYNPM